MSTQEYSAVLVRLDSLERRVRWRRAERLLTLALLGWLFASGPTAASLRERWRSLRFAGLSSRSALDWSFNEARSFITVQPVLDPKTVLEDEHEAFEESRPSMPAQAQAVIIPAKAVPLAARVESSSKPGHETTSQALGLLTAGLSINSLNSDSGARPNMPSPSAMSIPLAPPAPAAAGQSHAGLGASIREAERSFARASETGPKLAAIIPNLPFALSDSRSVGTGNGHAFTRPVPASLPAAQPDLYLGSAPQVDSAEPAPSSSSAPPAPAAGAPSVSLKALGYAESADGAQAVLTDGVTLYVVNEGEEFADRFRVTGIRPEGLDIEDRVTNTTFQLAFGH